MVDTPTRPPEKFVRGETDTLERDLLDWANAAGADEQNAVVGAIALAWFGGLGFDDETFSLLRFSQPELLKTTKSATAKPLFRRFSKTSPHHIACKRAD